MLNLQYVKCRISRLHSVKNLESREPLFCNCISAWYSNEHLLDYDAEGKATLFKIEEHQESLTLQGWKNILLLEVL